MLAIAILAAGKGTRMHSNRPKVLQRIGESTLLEHVLRTCDFLNPSKKIVIVGYKSKEIIDSLNQHKDIIFVHQEPQNGTGHAIKQLIPSLKNFKGSLLVLNGDVPLIKESSLKDLLEIHHKDNLSASILTSRQKNPYGYGRVFIDKKNYIKYIIEEKDCTAKESKNNLTNSGIYCFKWKDLKPVISKLNSNNKQQELYLTDTIKFFKSAKSIEIKDSEELLGINNKLQLSQCEKIFQSRLKSELMLKGLTFIDPDSCYISENCNFGIDNIIEPQTHIRGNCVIGDNCRIGPNTYIKDTIIGDHVDILYSYIDTSQIKNNIKIGPYAHIRPGSRIFNNSKIGNFVEIKNSIINKQVKINHLSYIGDSEIGESTNIGAGVITANYDGKNKFRTIIGNNSNIGANSVLIAPLNLGSSITIGGGSVITKDVPNNSLAISRSNQIIKEGWKKR
mgnify:CR=1 FL=1|tara:strand:+ start:18351 stop:19697 length:1347 start_codon:yes stop_codon:yes gene_type:complete